MMFLEDRSIYFVGKRFVKNQAFYRTEKYDIDKPI